MSMRFRGSSDLAETSSRVGAPPPVQREMLINYAMILQTSSDREVSLLVLTVSLDSLLLCLSDLTVTTFFIIFNLNVPCCRLIPLLLSSSTIALWLQTVFLT